MPDFDPQAYLAEPDSPPSIGSPAPFDPKSYLAEPDPVDAPQDKAGRLKQLLAEGDPFRKDPDLAQHLAGGLMTGSAGALGKWLAPAAEGAGFSLSRDNSDSTSDADRAKTAVIGGATAGVLGAATEGLSAGAQAAWPGVKSLGSKLGEMVTGVPKQEIQTYGEEGPAIQKMMAAADGSVPVAADTVREGWQQAIQDKKQALNTQISTALAAAPKKASVSIQPIIDDLEAQKAKLNPNFHAEAIGAINGIIAQVKTGAADASFGPKWAGMTNAENMNLIKQYLQGRASSSYAQGGQIFQSAPQAAQAAKGAAAKARGILNGMEPSVADANNQLSAIHDIDNDLNQNLIAPGKSDSALMAAGSGTNPRNAMLLDQLGAMTGKDMTGEAQQLAAAKTFTSPKWDPREMTGKSVGRALTGAALGGAAGYETGHSWEAGAVAGGLLASPAALKVAIDLGRPLVGAAQKYGPQALSALRGAAPIIGGQVANSSQPQAAPPPQQLANRAPTGEAKWSQDGLDKLGIQDQGMSAKLLADPKARQLLIQASDLKPGSPAMQKIMNQIRSKWGNNQ